MGSFFHGQLSSFVADSPFVYFCCFIDTVVKLDIDLEKLYYNMVEAKAEWLYELPQWNTLLSVERRKEIYREQKKSGTIVKNKKVGRNDPCPCGSGKKYKYCCGANK